MKIGRWFSFIAGQFMMLCSGSSYMFSLYSSNVKSNLGLTTTQMNEIGTLINVGMNFLECSAVLLLSVQADGSVYLAEYSWTSLDLFRPELSALL